MKQLYFLTYIFMGWVSVVSVSFAENSMPAVKKSPFQMYAAFDLFSSSSGLYQANRTSNNTNSLYPDKAISIIIHPINSMGNIEFGLSYYVYKHWLIGIRVFDKILDEGAYGHIVNYTIKYKSPDFGGHTDTVNDSLQFMGGYGNGSYEILGGIGVGVESGTNYGHLTDSGDDVSVLAPVRGSIVSSLQGKKYFFKNHVFNLVGMVSADFIYEPKSISVHFSKDNKKYTYDIRRSYLVIAISLGINYNPISY